MKTYHYCVSYQNIYYSDGTLRSDIDSMDDGSYFKFKDALGELMTPKRKGKEIILLSLTVIA